MQGRALYTFHCVVCHGGAAISGGSVPDLRHMDAETHQYFVGIVMGGMREPRGMPNFSDRLTIEQANAIHAYLVKRANDEVAATVPGQMNRARTPVRLAGSRRPQPVTQGVNLKFNRGPDLEPLPKRTPS